MLSADRTARLAALRLSYPEVGATAATLPRGYVHLVRHVTHDADAFASMVERLMTWQVHQDAGLGVVASAGRVQADAVVELRIGPPPLQVRAPCRVVNVVDEPDRVGFAYGTLDGHPERGEESFFVDRVAGEARFTIVAFSRPATALARVGGPLTRLVQDRVTERYLRAIHPR
ncbi:DUF1990 domain-containing protein [Aeromicrobium sp. SORGH_AS_0981]|uniref:DUF1990 family protein n=1 Tax=Aeromicrobium sp. SORGH_AS_0981 TaxID=3041802 RepID=UPI00286CE088|nr:DUF1990 domain-containing protein [Aeromicrobium sp. SORGH_AS_0981]